MKDTSDRKERPKLKKLTLELEFNIPTKKKFAERVAVGLLGPDDFIITRSFPSPLKRKWWVEVDLSDKTS